MKGGKRKNDIKILFTHVKQKLYYLVKTAEINSQSLCSFWPARQSTRPFPTAANEATLVLSLAGLRLSGAPITSKVKLAEKNCSNSRTRHHFNEAALTVNAQS